MRDFSERTRTPQPLTLPRDARAMTMASRAWFTTHCVAAANVAETALHNTPWFILVNPAYTIHAKRSAMTKFAALKPARNHPCFIRAAVAPACVVDATSAPTGPNVKVSAKCTMMLAVQRLSTPSDMRTLQYAANVTTTPPIRSVVGSLTAWKVTIARATDERLSDATNATSGTVYS